MSLGIYAGSFDPFTLGHVSILRGALKVFDQVIVAIGVNSAKNGTFSKDERVEIIEEYLKEFALIRASVLTFDGLLIDYCQKVKRPGVCPTIIRGLRAVSDFEQEMAIADINHKMDPNIQTVFIPAEAPHVYVSSSTAKELARHSKDLSRLSQYVLPSVAEKLIARYEDRHTLSTAPTS